MTSPWHITESAAALRDIKAASDLASVVRRTCAPGMPAERIIINLARYGYGPTELRRLGPAVIEIAINQNRSA